jgi:capsular polysaccharide biosynthesis protein
MNKLKEQLIHKVSSVRVTNKIKTNQEGLSKIESLEVSEDVTERARKLMNEIED